MGSRPAGIGGTSCIEVIGGGLAVSKLASGGLVEQTTPKRRSFRILFSWLTISYLHPIEWTVDY